MSTSYASAPRGNFPGQFTPGTPQSGRFRNNYQQSPPPNSANYGGSSGGGGGSGSSGGGRGHKDRNVTMMPNDIKIPKPPKQPDKPLPAYMRYSRKVWESVKTKNPEMKMWDIGKLIGEQWRNLPEEERQSFNAEYEIEKSEYQEAMKAYHNSPAYREWLKAKEKAQQAIQEQQMQEKMMGGSLPKEEPRFQLQQIEDDDEEGDFSVKHIAAARFQRNHRLVMEILSDTVVPDVKTIVTRPRHENLKRQVQSLMQHQRKLESEIQDMEEKFNTKKKKIKDDSDNFEEKIKEYLGPLPPLKSEDGDIIDNIEMAETPLVEQKSVDSPALPEVEDLVPSEKEPISSNTEDKNDIQEQPVEEPKSNTPESNSTEDVPMETDTRDKSQSPESNQNEHEK